MKERLYSIDVAKAICICLVVMGHFNPSVSLPWWESVTRVIYSFHMPAFIFLSGMLFAYTRRDVPYFSSVWKKFKRLMIPYFSASVVIIGIKILMQNLLHVKNPVSSRAFLEMFWEPSAAVHLWFIWVLMLIFILVYLFRGKWWTYLLLAASLVLWVTAPELPSVFAIDNLPRMMFFFICGALWQEWKSQKTGGWIPGAIIAVLFVSLEAVLVIRPDSEGVLQYILPFLGIGTLLALSELLCRKKSSAGMKALLCLGECSFFIFLFHTTFSEFAKALLSKAGFGEQSHFVICLLICVAAGILLPLIIQKLIVEKSKVLSFLFGVKK